MFFSESENVELKSIYVDDIKKEIVAFANSRGGKIYIGVESNGDVCGVDDTDFVIRQVSNAARDAIKPDVTMFMRCSVLFVGDKKVILVEVQCGAHRPYYITAKGLRPEGVYVRRGTSSVPASDAAIRQMIKETDGDIYEETRSLVQELTFDKASEEFKKRELDFSEPQMKTLGLIDSDGLYSNLALLLSDQCPHIIKAAAFDGVDNLNFQDRREFGGSLLKQLEDAYDYLSLRNGIAATFEGLLRIDHKDYPDVALRESLLNAIVHRDYSVSAPTLLGVYRNRVEIISVGGLAGGISYDDIMLGVSNCRNKNLANIFYRLQLIESYGTGMRKIIGSYSDSASKPRILVSSGAFKTVLPNRNQPVAVDETGKNPTAQSVSNNERELIDLFKKEKRLTRAKIEAVLGISTSTARRLLQELAKDGYITHEGQGKNRIYIFVE